MSLLSLRLTTLSLRLLKARPRRNRSSLKEQAHALAENNESMKGHIESVDHSDASCTQHEPSTAESVEGEKHATDDRPA